MLGRRGEERKGDNLSFSAEIPKKARSLLLVLLDFRSLQASQYSDTRFSDGDSKFHRVTAQARIPRFSPSSVPSFTTLTNLVT